MNTIDETTGLPELPEGLFFHVRSTAVELRLHIPEGEWQSTPPYAGMYDYRTVKAGWFRTRKEYRRQKSFEVLGTEETEFMSEDLEKRYKEFFYSFQISYMYRVPVTKEFIREAAQKLLDRYIENQEMKKLLGDYPPNKLEA